MKRWPWRMTSGKNCRIEREQQQADVHAVHVGVGGDDDAVVAQAVHAVLDVERGLEEVEFLVLVDDLLGQAIGVERLALEGEDGLRLDIARGGEGAGGGVALDDEEGGFLGAGVAVAEVEAAVAELLVVEGGFLARSRAMLRMPASSLRSCSFSSILDLMISAVSRFLCR